MKRQVVVAWSRDTTSSHSRVMYSTCAGTFHMCCCTLRLPHVHFLEAPSTLRRRNLKTEFSLWKRIKRFPFNTAPEEYKNAAITGRFWFVFEENSGREITWLSWRHRFRKAPFLKCFPSTRKRKPGGFKFLRFEERFWKIFFFKSVFVTD